MDRWPTLRAELVSRHHRLDDDDPRRSGMIGPLHRSDSDPAGPYHHDDVDRPGACGIHCRAPARGHRAPEQRRQLQRDVRTDRDAAEPGHDAVLGEARDQARLGYRRTVQVHAIGPVELMTLQHQCSVVAEVLLSPGAPAGPHPAAASPARPRSPPTCREPLEAVLPEPSWFSFHLLLPPVRSVHAQRAWARSGPPSGDGGPDSRHSQCVPGPSPRRTPAVTDSGRLRLGSTEMVFVCRNSLYAVGPCSRPIPDFLKPPKGEPRSAANVLTENVPARTRRATSNPCASSAVNTAPERPSSLSFAMRTASSSPLCAMREAIGPKISSRDTCMELSASVTSVGSKYQPRSRPAGRRPPVAIVAPSLRASSTYCSTRSR